MVVWNIIAMIVTVGVFVLTVDVAVGMVVTMFVGVSHTVVGVFMGVQMAVFMIVLQGNGIFHHQNGGSNHDGQTDPEL